MSVPTEPVSCFATGRNAKYDRHLCRILWLSAQHLTRIARRRYVGEPFGVDLKDTVYICAGFNNDRPLLRAGPVGTIVTLSNPLRSLH